MAQDTRSGRKINPRVTVTHAKPIACLELSHSLANQPVRRSVNLMNGSAFSAIAESFLDE